MAPLYIDTKNGYEKITSETIDQYNQAVIDEGALGFDKKTYMNGSNNYFEKIAKIDAMFNVWLFIRPTFYIQEIYLLTLRVTQTLPQED